jgi:RNA polymerase sigma-70 factor, ECF subfamily
MKTSIDLQLTFTGWVSDLARAHSHALIHVARAEGLTADDALDAVQEAFATFMRLPRARDLVGFPDDTRALMTVVVRNAARNQRRRHHRARPHDSLDETTELSEALPSVDELLLEAERHAQLRGCVDRLEELQGHVVRMRMLEQASGADVAEKLGLTPGHVAVFLHRAKRELLRCMVE